MTADGSGSSLRPVTVDGREWLEITDGGAVYLVDRFCPHQGADLAAGTIVDGALKCPRHGYLFELTSGEGLNCRYRLPCRSAGTPAQTASPSTRSSIEKLVRRAVNPVTATHRGGGLDLVLRGGRLVDPDGPLQGLVDIGVAAGRIVAIEGHPGSLQGSQEIDLAGSYVSAGFVDVHVHGFGALGFADLDTVGVLSGCTTVCDAGGAGAYSIDELAAQLADSRTRLRSWLYIGPGGISVSLVGQEQGSDMRSIIPELPVARLFQVVERYGDLVAGIKVPAFGPTGERGPMMMAKGLAVSLGLPLYVHVGDIQEQQPPSLDVAAVIDILDAGDIVTHCYSPNPNGLLGGDGKLLSCVGDALQRGVHFDVGMGAFNFDSEVARRCIQEGFVASTISSDLQQANITGPTWSLAHVASMFLALGLSLDDVIQRITSSAAYLLGLGDEAGIVRVGRSADLTVFDVVEKETAFQDTRGVQFFGDREIVPRLVLRSGELIDVNLAPARERSNWSQWTSRRAASDVDSSDLSDEVAAFVESLVNRLDHMETWETAPLYRAYEEVLGRSGVTRTEAARAVLGAFLDPVFPQSPPLFVATQQRWEATDRLRRRCRPATRDNNPVSAGSTTADQGEQR